MIPTLKMGQMLKMKDHVCDNDRDDVQEKMQQPISIDDNSHKRSRDGSCLLHHCARPCLQLAVGFTQQHTQQ